MKHIKRGFPPFFSFQKNNHEYSEVNILTELFVCLLDFYVIVL